MEDFSMYNIPYNSSVDWHSIHPTFFHMDVINKTRVSETDNASATNLAGELDYENTRPVSAYAMFFKEQQLVVKKSFPEATFGDVSKIVAAEWDSLGKELKLAYKRRSEQLRRTHIRMAAKDRVQKICGSLGRTNQEKNTSEKKTAKALSSQQLVKNGTATV